MSTSGRAGLWGRQMYRGKSGKQNCLQQFEKLNSWINITKEIKDLYSENFRTLKKKSLKIKGKDKKISHAHRLVLLIPWHLLFNQKQFTDSDAIATKCQCNFSHAEMQRAKQSWVIETLPELSPP